MSLPALSNDGDRAFLLSNSNTQEARASFETRPVLREDISSYGTQIYPVEIDFLTLLRPVNQTDDYFFEQHEWKPDILKKVRKSNYELDKSNTGIVSRGIRQLVFVKTEEVNCSIFSNCFKPSFNPDYTIDGREYLWGYQYLPSNSKT